MQQFICTVVVKKKTTFVFASLLSENFLRLSSFSCCFLLQQNSSPETLFCNQSAHSGSYNYSTSSAPLTAPEQSWEPFSSWQWLLKCAADCKELEMGKTCRGALLCSVWGLCISNQPCGYQWSIPTTWLRFSPCWAPPEEENLQPGSAAPPSQKQRGLGPHMQPAWP